MKRDIGTTILFTKKYLLKKYNYLIIDINTQFIGCKFYNSDYYIFFVSFYNGRLTITYRENFLQKNVIRIIIDDYSDSKIEELIDEIMLKADIVNKTLDKPKKMLKNSLINYQYKETENKRPVINADEEKNNKKILEVGIVPIEYILKNNNDFETIKDIPLKNIVISKRLFNVLINNGINTIEELMNQNFSEVIKLRNLGKKSIDELETFINQINQKYNYEIVSFDNNVKDEKIQKIQAFEDTFDKQIIDSQYSKTSIDDCGLSIRLKNALIKHNIYYLNDFLKTPIVELKEYPNLGKKCLKEVVDLKIKVIEQNTFSDDNSDYIFNVIQNISDNESISIIMLKNHLTNNTNYPVEKLINDLGILRTSGKIEYTMDGVRIRYPHLKNVLEGIDSLSDKMILIERFNGKTLEEIGKQRNVTRERIRQKLAKLVKRIPKVYEDKYVSIYGAYSFSLDEFCSIYNEDKLTYYYLKEKYESGTRRLDEALDDIRFNEKQKDIIRKYYKIIKLNGVSIVLNKHNVINELIKEYAKNTIRVEKFTELYNSFCRTHPDYNLEESDERSMEGIISRSGITITGIGKNFRYYDYDSVDNNEVIEVEKLYNLETGYYSTLILFNNNKELMNNLDIKNEYELHNFSKNRINNKNVSFDRMPNFSINGIDKNDFFEEKIKELSPISLNDFLEIMESEYGHKSNTLSAYITGTFYDYLDSGVLKSDIIVLPDYEIEKIKYILKDPIYNLDDLKVLLKDSGFDNVDDIISNANMYKIGYRIRSSYVIKKEINSVEDYLRETVNKNDFVPNYNFLKNYTYSGIMKKIEKTFDIFLISNEEYITIKKLNSLGIFKEDIVQFCESVKSVFKKSEYFTLFNVREMIDINKLDDFGFDDIFFENIIGNIDNNTCTKFSNNKIFSFVNVSFDSKKFVLDNIGSRISISIDDLQSELLDKYGINVTQERIKNAIIDTEMYYSDELNKIYQNKEYYYEEVFSYE